MKPGDFVMRVDGGGELVVSAEPEFNSIRKEVARLPPKLATLATVIEVKAGQVRALNAIKIVTVDGVVGWVPEDEFHEA